VTLDDLTYFLAVAETGLAHRAAAIVGISQPALTKSIQRLESQLGMPLFERSPKGMQLTTYGIAFQRHAVGLRAAYEDALHQMDEIHRGTLAKVRIGATPATEPLVTSAFVSLLVNRPALHLDSIVQLSDALMRALRNGVIDIAVAPVPLPLPDDLVAVQLSSQTTSIVCRSKHPLMKLHGEATAKDLAKYSWILPGPGVSARHQLTTYFQKNNVEGPHVQVQSDYSSPSGVFHMTANTDLLSICSTQYQAMAERLGLRILETKDGYFPREIACLMRKQGELSPLTSTFLDQLVKEVTKEKTYEI
jgi:DNA-binding transcriptional LysR family regulator